VPRLLSNRYTGIPGYGACSSLKAVQITFTPKQQEPYRSHPFQTSDFTYNFNGVVTTGGEAVWNANLRVYSSFTSHFHEPTFLVIFETTSGYALIGIANPFANLPAPGEQRKADLSGKKWDIGAPGCFPL